MSVVDWIHREPSNIREPTDDIQELTYVAAVQQPTASAVNYSGSSPTTGTFNQSRSNTPIPKREYPLHQNYHEHPVHRQLPQNHHHREHPHQYPASSLYGFMPTHHPAQQENYRPVPASVNTPERPPSPVLKPHFNHNAHYRPTPNPETQTQKKLAAIPEPVRIDTSFGCPFQDCGKTFTRTGNYKTHYLSAHTLSRPHTCGHCGMTFVRKHDLSRHAQSHGPKVTFKCEACGKGYSRRDGLSRHNAREHGGQRASAVVATEATESLLSL